MDGTYKRIRKNLFFWRTPHQDEVDLIVDNDFAIEIKACHKATAKHYRSLKKLRDEGFRGKLVLLSQDPIRRNDGEVELWFWEDFLNRLWSGQ